MPRSRERMCELFVFPLLTLSTNALQEILEWDVVTFPSKQIPASLGGTARRIGVVDKASRVTSETNRAALSSIHRLPRAVPA